MYNKKQQKCQKYPTIEISLKYRIIVWSLKCITWKLCKLQNKY